MLIKIDKITVSGENSKITTLKNIGTLGDVESKDGGEITSLVNLGHITGTITLNEKTKSIENTGSITGSLNFNNAITKLVNKGTISNFTASKEIAEFTNASALTLQGAGQISKSLMNEQNGRLSGVDIYFNGNSPHTLDNKGTIENKIFNPKNSNLDFKNEGDMLYLKNEGTISSLQNSNAANLQSLINTGNINTKLDNKGTISSLENSGRVGQGLENAGTISTLKNSGSIDASFSNSGMLSAFENSGNINANLDNTSQISSLKNSGTIMGIKNSGTIDSLENTGTIKPDSNKEHIKNENGKISVLKWYIPSTKAIPLKAHQNFSNLSDVDSRLVVSGAKSTDVDFSGAEIYIDARFYDVNVEYDIKNSILLKNSPHRASSASPLSISDMKDPKAFEIIYAKDTGMFIINPHSEALLGAVFADFLLNYVTRRALFIDTLLWGQAKNLDENEEGKDFYFLPFYARDDFSLNTRDAHSKANTKGFVSGFHSFDGLDLTELYWGFDDATSHTRIKDAKVDTSLKGEHKAFLVGLNHTHFLEQKSDLAVSWQNGFKFVKRAAKLKLFQEGSADEQDSVNIYGVGLASYLQWQRIEEKYDLSFKIGGGYQGFRIGSFELATPNEKQRVNLFYNNTSFIYTRKFTQGLSSTLELGNRYLLSNEIATHFKGDEDSFKLPRNYAFAEFGTRYDLNKRIYFNLNYHGTFARNGQSHSGFLSTNYKW